MIGTFVHVWLKKLQLYSNQHSIVEPQAMPAPTGRAEADATQRSCMAERFTRRHVSGIIWPPGSHVIAPLQQELLLLYVMPLPTPS